MQRLGMMIDPTDLAKRIRNHELECVGKQTNSRTIFLYEHNGKKYYVVYSISTKDVITIFPEGDTNELNLLYDKKQKKWDAFLKELKEQYEDTFISEEPTNNQDI